MAQIPYGYRIEKGRAIADTDDAARIGSFITAYLGGLSVKQAKITSEIPLSESSLNQLLQNETYLGTDYYPPLMTAEVFHSVQKERQKRTHPATTRPSDPVPVKCRFVVTVDDEPTVTTRAAEMAAHLYTMITASPDGRESASGVEIRAMRGVAEKICTGQQDAAEKIKTACHGAIEEIRTEQERRHEWQ